jgi:hypothetical protein
MFVYAVLHLFLLDLLSDRIDRISVCLRMLIVLM